MPGRIADRGIILLFTGALLVPWIALLDSIVKLVF